MTQKAKDAVKGMLTAGDGGHQAAVRVFAGVGLEMSHNSFISVLILVSSVSCSKKAPKNGSFCRLNGMAKDNP